jgi:predicted HTH transcriptional regulator
MSYQPPFSITREILNLVADQQADSTPFIHFMLSVMAQALAQNAPVNGGAEASVDLNGLKTPEAIVALLSANPKLTRQQLADFIAKDLRTIGRALAKLQELGKIKRIGSDKTGHWEVHL